MRKLKLIFPVAAAATAVLLAGCNDHHEEALPTTCNVPTNGTDVDHWPASSNATCGIGDHIQVTSVRPAAKQCGLETTFLKGVFELDDGTIINSSNEALPFVINPGDPSVVSNLLSGGQVSTTITFVSTDKAGKNITGKVNKCERNLGKTSGKIMGVITGP